MPSKNTGVLPPLILVVDDNLDAREMYCMYLEHDGFRCVECADGVSAIEAAEANHPDLILMDATMPGIDGWEATRRLKGNPATTAIPIVMLTAHAFVEHRERAADVGAIAFLPKPILPDDLAREVAHSEARRHREGQTIWLAVVSNSTPTVGRRRLPSSVTG